ncbi:ParA family protein [Vibrio natriegens]|uniref:ParA family protein n=1 Tax=Vibrio natriegens TaxID=691 RepID=UPI0030B925DF
MSLHYSQAKKILIMNQKGGVGKSTFVAGLMSQLIHQGYRVELIDFDKQKSSHDWAVEVIPGGSQAYNPSLRSFSNMATTLRVKQNTDFVILDSPSNFTRDDMARYTYFVDAVILPMSPSPVDLHSSLPFIQSILESGVLSARNISMAFVVNRCQQVDPRVRRVHQLLQHFRHYPTLGMMSEDAAYQEAFYYRALLPRGLDVAFWAQVMGWLRRL